LPSFFNTTQKSLFQDSSLVVRTRFMPEMKNTRPRVP
jgi:hypothetical protein